LARILVVEDEPSTRYLTREALSSVGYQVDDAASGEEAIEKLRSSSYDVMLLDLRMPGMDGTEVLRRVQESYPDLSVIVLTAYATVDSAILAVKAGAADYLRKPSSLRDIESAVSRALQRKREQLRRQHLIGVIAGALEALQSEDARTPVASDRDSERFLQHGAITLDRQRRLVAVAMTGDAGGHGAELTEAETALLACLMQSPDTPLPCRELARDALGYNVEDLEAEDIVRPHISRLRRKLDPDRSHPSLIRTVRGKGYLLSSK
jgi:DNA-binding response OmpR family regulator